MNVTANEQQVIPYSHHYRCFPQMVGSVVNQAVFMYLFDEYLFRLKTGRPTEFVISVNEISQKRNIHRNTVASSIVDLQKMGLLTVNDKICTINADTYFSLIQSFNSLVSTADKKKFIEALSKGNYGTLEKLGFRKSKNGNTQFLSQVGDVQNYAGLYKNVQHAQNCTDLHKNVHVAQNCTGLYKIVQGCTKMYKVVQKCTTILDEIRREVQENFTKMEFIDEFREYFLDFLDEEEFGRLVGTIFDDVKPENATFGVEFTLFLHRWGLYKIVQGGCTKLYNSDSKVVQNCTTVNKEENKKEINQQSDEKGEDFEFDKTGLEQSLSGYKKNKLKQSLPFFPVREVEEYISDIRNCLDRADKMFINTVWTIAHECYDQDAILDENGKEQLSANNNIELASIPRERLMKDILFPAFDQVQEMIEGGHITVNGEDYPITATIDNPDDFSNIIDWELQTLVDGDYYIVSSSRVRNIYAQVIEQASSRSVTRDNREDDMEYMRKIVMIGDDDARYSQLTPIELAVYNFLVEYFQIGDNWEVEEPKGKFVSKTNLAMFYEDAKGKGVSKSDFLSVLSKDKPDTSGCLNLRQRMFSAEKIRSMNRMYSAESVIDTLET